VLSTLAVCCACRYVPHPAPLLGQPPGGIVSIIVFSAGFVDLSHVDLPQRATALDANDREFADHWRIRWGTFSPAAVVPTKPLAASENLGDQSDAIFPDGFAVPAFRPRLLIEPPSTCRRRNDKAPLWAREKHLWLVAQAKCLISASDKSPNRQLSTAPCGCFHPYSNRDLLTFTVSQPHARDSCPPAQSVRCTQLTITGTAYANRAQSSLTQFGALKLERIRLQSASNRDS